MFCKTKKHSGEISRRFSTSTPPPPPQTRSFLALKEPFILHIQHHGCRCRLSMYGWTKFSNYLTRMRNGQNLATKWTRKRKRLICNLTHVYTSQHFKTSFTYDPETTARLLLQNTPTSEVNLVTMQYIVMNGWFTSFSFHVNRPPHSWDKAISDFELETPRSRSWMWSKGKVIQSAQYHINSLPFHFTSIIPSIPDTAISKFDLETSKFKVTCEVKGQCHILYLVSNQCTSVSFHIN